MMNFKFAKYKIAVSNCDHRGGATIIQNGGKGSYPGPSGKAGEELAKGKKLNGQNI